ncbi:MAG: multidrug ABC transporter substrate-binding protein [Hydrogenophilales bacterium CG03_land_8_20_14_0_80_62_28]|nr:FtsX-like permease family protein [Betaproteobacteria bacterium]OIO79053.1 MAG: multidrug ABC transporter substrate-binding protein [Hydrogenophilaceae bacterium CG1_02_62_390]PIV23890.1 MAG: multidrug ABC transporter substrate-binding protein [Hydrogenophilales bacterium CG03_land_8_20_14_0_80_62_28]PIW38057.1 MAG: multidrug ABC transporter substrate-binding protein [Hydrogenophilales bacterium CG15_BIG_FIL_POST_REV_8_21_14_020_62_31]PIW71195.1 MAG: multidrug ABC transporter substrate-bindi
MTLWLSMLGEALQAMSANKLRTFLTALGIIIGVGAVVLMVALGQGTQSAVTKSISALGSNLLIIRSGSPQQGGFRSGAGGLPTLTTGDALALQELTSLKAVSPVIQQGAQLVYGPNNWGTQVVGSTDAYLDIRDWTLQSGRSFTDTEMNSGMRVAILGQTVAEQLFGNADPIDQSVRIHKSPYQVIGVLAPKGQSMDGRDQDDTVIIPLVTAQRQLVGTRFKGTVSIIMAKANSAQQLASGEAQITDLLHQRHRIAEGVDNDFSVTNMASIASTMAQVTGMLSILLGSIAGISLFVGGIGIMNIMMVSVTERTREIGIRMAIGASRKTVLLQFLLEAVIITTTGGLIGILIGIGLALGVQRFGGISVAITPQPILLAFGVSTLVGLFFGLYPARKASRLKPIEALRYQ